LQGISNRDALVANESAEDESYFAALIRTYARSIRFVSTPPPAERTAYLKRLDKVTRAERRLGGRRRI
jgi:hypothetical protein